MVPYTLSDNRITQNYLAFSRITGNLKQDFTFTKKMKTRIHEFIPRITNHGKIKFSITRHGKKYRGPSWYQIRQLSHSIQLLLLSSSSSSGLRHTPHLLVSSSSSPSAGLALFLSNSCSSEWSSCYSLRCVFVLKRDWYFRVLCVVTIIREQIFVFKKHTKFACVVVTCLDMFQCYPL